MKIFLGGETARNILRWKKGPTKTSRTKGPTAKDAPSKAQADTVLDNLDTLCLTEAQLTHIQSHPLNLIVSSEKQRRGLRNVVCRSIGAPLPASSFCTSGIENIYVASAELCFLQYASEATFEELVCYGYEICGTYALDPYNEKGFIPNRPQLTTPAALSTFLGKMEGVSGVKRARSALKWIRPLSASPMETKTTLLFCLPLSKGGFSLPMPKLNDTVCATDSLGKKSFFKCDLAWPDKHVAVEYDSDMFHSEDRKRAKDANRRILLEQSGLHVVSLKRAQVLNANMFREAAFLVAKYLGKRIQVKRSDWMMRNYLLRKSFFSATQRL